MVFFSFGCDKRTDNTEESQKISEDNSVLKQLSQDYKEYEWKCDVALNEIKEVGNQSLFITNDGELYQYSLDKIFSNEKYCKKLETELKFNRFFDSLVATQNNELYEVNIIGGTINFEKLESYHSIVKTLKKYSNNFFIFHRAYKPYGFDSMTCDYTIVDNKIVYSIICGDGNNNILKSELGKLSDDESFISSSGNIIKTSKNFYYNSILNREECDKYVDIKCNYGLVKITDMSKIYDDVYYFNGLNLILKSRTNTLYVIED